MRFRSRLALLVVIPPLALGQRQSRPLTNGALPAVSPKGDVIAFVSNRDGNYDVYVTTADGAQNIRITNTPAPESAPVWTADGRVVFATWADNRSTVYAASEHDPTPKVIGTSPGRQPSISPDGKKLLYSKGQFPSLQLTESALDGSDERELTRTPSAQFNGAYSPDQKLIAFARMDSTRQLQVWVMNADGSGERQLTHFRAEDGSPQWPAWSPDGARLAIQSGKYDRQNPSRNTAHIWVSDVKSGAATRLNPHDTPYLDETPSWFPDGKRIAFQSDRSGRMEIWVMSADGSGAVQVTR